MMYRFKTLISVLASLLTVACAQSETEIPVAGQSAANSVWTLDLVRTLPGQQAEYIRSIEANWAGARSLGLAQGVVLSYRAFVASVDSARGWDVVLMTEYVDSVAWADREAIFQEIFASPEYVRTPTEVPSSELRAFAASGVVLREFVSESSR